MYTTPQVKKVDPKLIAGVAGSTADAEAMVCLKDMINRLGGELLCTEDSFPLNRSG